MGQFFSSQELFDTNRSFYNPRNRRTWAPLHLKDGEVIPGVLDAFDAEAPAFETFKAGDFL